MDEEKALSLTVILHLQACRSVVLVDTVTIVQKSVSFQQRESPLVILPSSHIVEMTPHAPDRANLLPYFVRIRSLQFAKLRASLDLEEDFFTLRRQYLVTKATQSGRIP